MGGIFSEQQEPKHCTIQSLLSWSFFP